MADYISLVNCIGVVVLTFCFFAWLFEEDYFRWTFSLLASAFLYVLVNVGREIAELNGLTDIESLLKVSSWSLAFIILTFISVFLILFLIDSFKSLIKTQKKKAGYPDSDDD